MVVRKNKFLALEHSIIPDTDNRLLLELVPQYRQRGARTAAPAEIPANPPSAPGPPSSPFRRFE
jgi:hypothetical protein